MFGKVDIRKQFFKIEPFGRLMPMNFALFLNVNFAEVCKQVVDFAFEGIELRFEFSELNLGNDDVFKCVRVCSFLVEFASCNADVF